MKPPSSVDALSEFGRARLSNSFFMRDFLYSDIAALHGFSNIPEDPDLAIAAARSSVRNCLSPCRVCSGASPSGPPIALPK